MFWFIVYNEECKMLEDWVMRIIELVVKKLVLNNIKKIFVFCKVLLKLFLCKLFYIWRILKYIVGI